MNSNYEHILVAVDLQEDCHVIVDKALQLARQCGARLTLLHVVEYLFLDFGNELVLPQYQDIEQQLVERARQQIKEIEREIDYNQVQGAVETGATRSVIIETAQREGVDLIVMGRHSRSGLAQLLGSTANSVLHHAPCDIFIIRV